LSVWLIYGTFDVGYLHTSGAKTALYDRYTRWPTDGPASTSTSMRAARRRAATPRCAAAGSARGQYYEAVYGKAGSFKAEAFVRDMSNLLSTDRDRSSTA